MKARGRTFRKAPLIMLVLALYCVCYGWRLVRVNRVKSHENVMASELPEECREGLETYDEPSGHTFSHRDTEAQRF